MCLNGLYYAWVIKAIRLKSIFYNYEIMYKYFTIELGSKNIKMYFSHSETG